MGKSRSLLKSSQPTLALFTGLLRPPRNALSNSIFNKDSTGMCQVICSRARYEDAEEITERAGTANRVSASRISAFCESPKTMVANQHRVAIPETVGSETPCLGLQADDLS